VKGDGEEREGEAAVDLEMGRAVQGVSILATLKN